MQFDLGIERNRAREKKKKKKGVQRAKRKKKKKEISVCLSACLFFHTAANVLTLTHSLTAHCLSLRTLFFSNTLHKKQLYPLFTFSLSSPPPSSIWCPFTKLNLIVPTTALHCTSSWQWQHTHTLLAYCFAIKPVSQTAAWPSPLLLLRPSFFHQIEPTLVLKKNQQFSIVSSPGVCVCVC